MPNHLPSCGRLGVTLAQCQQTAPGRDSIFDLQLLSQCTSMYNCTGRSAQEITLCLLLGRPTTQTDSELRL